MRTLRLAVPALAVCLALGACGGQGTGDGTPTPTGASPVTDSPIPEPTTPGAVPPTSPAAPTQPVPTVSPKQPGGPTKPPPVGAATLTGKVESGVEPGCLLLDGYLLIGGPRDVLTAGATVTVTGKIQPDMMTTCQQGIPFLVETASRRG
ncbi:hypothetical protein AB0873_14250 [Micromonospora sp. NPDC047707]|uniref:hypothetical protein n=1 Tax=unclassified Micromonospora TaxID=2617518 RepID=UPI0012B4BF87|nr:hypothetical protein [Micromonospora sp. WMMC415]QGN45403.1 hypothetical protein GKC29_00110 [Micromonospora sp. WMMC415]